MPVPSGERPVGADTPFPHLRRSGEAHMVDVGAKPETDRRAVARGRVLLDAGTLAALRSGSVPKGDALAVARIAGIMGAKRTPDLVPLCHPLRLSGVRVEVLVGADAVLIEAEVATTDRTGVEMEALTAVVVAGLSVVDMVKALDPAATITDVQVVSKRGGTTADWVRPTGSVGAAGAVGSVGVAGSAGSAGTVEAVGGAGDPAATGRLR